MKWLVRFFILLSLILLTGYGQLYAPSSSSEHLTHAPLKLSESSKHVNLDIAESRLIQIIKFGLPQKQRVTEKLEISGDENEDDNDDDKLISFKKYSALNNNFFTAFLYAHNLGLGRISKRLFDHTHFTRFSSCRYILLQVFRI